MIINMCVYSGAVNVNFTGMMRKRFLSGKIGLYDLVPTEEGREKFKVSAQYTCTLTPGNIHTNIV